MSASTHDTKIKVTADTAQATSAVQKLQKSFGGMMSDAGTAMVKLNQSLEILEKGVRAVQIGMGLAKFSAEFQNLEKRVPVERIKMLEAASGGAVSKMDLMRVAVKSMNGELGLTDKGMKTAMSAANALADTVGGDTLKVFEDLKHALQTGQTKALTQYGIKVDETRGKQKAINELLIEMQVIAAKGFNVDPNLEAINKLQAATQNWVNDMKVGLGEIIIFSVKAADRLSSMIAGVEYGDADDPARMRRAAASKAGDELFITGVSRTDIDMVAMAAADPSAVGPAVSRLGPRYASVRQQYDDALATNMKLEIKRIEKLKADAYDRTQKISAGLMPDPERPGEWITEKYLRDRLKGTKASDFLGPGFNKIDDGKDKGGGYTLGSVDAITGRQTFGSEFNMAAMEATLAQDAARGGRSVSSLIANDDRMRSERADVGAYNEQWESDRRSRDWTDKNDLGKKLGFGGAPVDSSLASLNAMNDALDMMADRTSFAGAGWSALNSGMSVAIATAIEGGDGMAAAIMKAMAASLKATAIDAGVQALYNTAKGIAGLATGNPAATGFFGAAAKFAATAVAAGAGSALLGNIGGGGSGSSGVGAGAGGGAVRPPTRGGSDGAGETIIIQVGDGFVGDAPALGDAINQKLKAGRRAGRVRDGRRVVRFS